ncbi:YbhB/YbcL family Raf kinase inhibitor-like protein [Pseudooceanicola sp. CBS1P-1]|uniref:YbhB/YbcL family Raf kinase inhibitor-like protein n=1 Tax=Pseudooceanicola albus TaxID=2692189 RepID=A0A6L7GC29_9RHOB|nr:MULTISPECIES: YbhB/YbcL family Raf kinase inhibitor-like protein [Pseudooceanicola]MBT9386314.1 YbhB/YbcL family Raf kinase inhibitor-like protein [Pseudooceanicola endophyticus]MXN20363.1 YbhB/YbcL family Raf kinase inhibitor-like protein [Pseudooceanicola albus]
MHSLVSRATAGLLAALLLAPAARAQMELTDLSATPGGSIAPAQVLSGFGCTGGNRSPALRWSGAPAGTKSYIVTMYDPDAPTGSGLWHWSVFDIPGSASGLEAGALPQGAVAARNDFSINGYSGACPPEGQTHRYRITVYAMGTERLALDSTASGAMVGFFAENGALDRAQVTLPYGRKDGDEK